MPIRLLKAATVATAALFTAGCVSLTTPSTFGLDVDSAAAVRKTCTDIMGLQVGPEFEACTGSLANTVRNIQDSHLIALADAACEQQGLKQGTAELAKCVVRFRSANRPTPIDIAMPTVADAESRLAYFSMNAAQKYERAELSCAQLGLHPSWRSFDYCVTDLRRSINEFREWSMQ